MVVNCAPILVSVYNRREHLQKCVESLAVDPLSKHSDLYVVSDAPSSPVDTAKVDLVRQYIDQIKGFRSVVAIARERNLGSYLSVKGAIDDILGTDGRVIFIEDDNIVSSNFLDFLNDGLNFYQNDLSIFSISGYNFPIRIPESYLSDVYKWQGFSAWGVGLWLDRWQGVDWEYTGFDHLVENRRRKQELDHVAEHLYQYISHDIQRGRKIIDTVISYYMFTKDLYSIFPLFSKVRNIGHDGTGEHGGVTDRYSRQPLDPGLPYRFVSGLRPDERINRVLRHHFRTPPKAKAFMMISRFLPEGQKIWLKQRLTSRRAAGAKRRPQSG